MKLVKWFLWVVIALFFAMGMWCAFTGAPLVLITFLLLYVAAMGWILYEVYRLEDEND